jgi:hypothetical protein
LNAIFFGRRGVDENVNSGWCLTDDGSEFRFGCVVVVKATHSEGGVHVFTGVSKLGASLGAWILHGPGSANPILPGHVLLTGRVPGDKWAVSDGRVHGSARSIGSGSLSPSLQAQAISDLQNPIASETQRRWLDELATLNSQFAARHPGVAELDSRTESFQTAYRMQTAAPEAFDVENEIANPALRKLYGLDPLPTRSTEAKLLLARRLVERGVRFVLVPSMKVPSLEGGTGDWDTHTPTPVRGVIPNLAKACDQPMAGLITDLKDRGLLDQTLVVWCGEMGRGGNGHMNHNGNAFTWWMAGGGVRAGSVYGATDEQGFTAVENPVHVRDLHATILWLCGLDHRQFKHNGVGFDDSCKVATEMLA